jgi:hypothetical protein
MVKLFDHVQPRLIVAAITTAIAFLCIVEVGRRTLTIFGLWWYGTGIEVGQAAIAFYLKYAGSLAVAAAALVPTVVMISRRRWWAVTVLSAFALAFLFAADHTRIRAWSRSREEFIKSFFNAFQKECRSFTVADDCPSPTMVWLGLKAPPVTRWSDGISWVPDRLVFCDDDQEELLQVAREIFPDAQVSRSSESRD